MLLYMLYCNHKILASRKQMKYLWRPLTISETSPQSCGNRIELLMKFSNFHASIVARDIFCWDKFFPVLEFSSSFQWVLQPWHAPMPPDLLLPLIVQIILSDCGEISDIPRDSQWSKRTDEESQMFRSRLLLSTVESKSNIQHQHHTIRICLEWLGS